MHVGCTNCDLSDFVYRRNKTFEDNCRKDIALAACEILLSNKLKILCDRNGAEIHPKTTAEILDQLGQVYRQRSPDKLSLVRSAILLNAALKRKPKHFLKIEKNIDELCFHVLALAGATKTDVSLTDEANRLKEFINAFRQTVEEQLGMIQQKFDLQESHSQVVEAMKQLQEDIHDWYCKLMKSVMDDCVSIMGNVPCEYALVGMGSLARKEITPYSDFEHIILLEEGVQERADYDEILEYFRWVSVIFNIIVINVGETIVPCAALPYLNNCENKTHNWFYDGITKRGISFDGMFPHASKFPLGRLATPRKPWKTELIKPVSAMLKYLSDEEDIQNGYHLADILTISCFVSGYQEIFAQFRSNVIKRSISKVALQTQLEEDIQNFNPVTNFSKISQQQTWNMKRVVYRSTTLFISALGRHYGLCENGSFDTIQKLVERGDIKEDFAHDLSYAVAIACYIRLFTYLLNDRQEDWLDSPSTDDKFALEFTQIMGLDTPVFYFLTAMRLQRETCRTFGLSNNKFVQWSPRLDRLLACFWLQQYESTSWEAKKIYSDSSNNTGDVRITNEVLLVVGSTYFQKKNFVKALACFQNVYAIVANSDSRVCKDDEVHCLHFIGRCFGGLKDHENALKYCQLELEIRKQAGKSDEGDAEIATCHSNIAIVLKTLQQYEKAIEHIKLAVCVREKMNMERDQSEKEKSFEKSKTKQTVEDGAINVSKKLVQCSEQRKKSIEPPDHFELTDNKRKIENSLNKDTDVTLATYYHLLGSCLFKMKKLDEAKMYFERAQTIHQTVSDSSLRKNLASDVIWIGHCLYQMQLYHEALSYYQSAIQIRKQSCENSETDATLAVYCHGAACCLFEIKKFHEAKAHFEKAKKIRETNGHPSLRKKLEWDAKLIGDCLYRVRVFDVALKFYEEAIEKRVKTCENEKADSTLAAYCHKAGTCLYQMKQFDRAKVNFERAKTIRESNGDLASNDDLACDAKRCGDCLYQMQVYDESLKYYEEAVKIREGVCPNEKTDATLAIYCHCAGCCLCQMKHFGQAKVYFERAKIIRETNGDPSLREDLASNANWIGDCLYQVQVFDEALKQYEEAVKMREKACANEKTDSTLASYCHKAGTCLYQMKQFDRAKVNFERAKTIRESNGAPSLCEKILLDAKWIGHCLYQMQEHDFICG